jgi:hypothetical protein
MSFSRSSVKSVRQPCKLQPASLWVWVYQLENNKLIPAASVTISGPMNRRGQVSKGGPCVFECLTPGTYEVTASAIAVPGYETSRVVTAVPVRVTIEAGDLGTAAIYVELHKVAIKLLDSKGHDVGNAAYEMVTPGGVTFKSQLKADGSRRVAGIPAGNCKVRFPDYDRDLIEFVSSSEGT